MPQTYPWEYEPRSVYNRRRRRAWEAQARQHGLNVLMAQQMQSRGFDPDMIERPGTMFDRPLITGRDVDDVIKPKAEKQGRSLLGKLGGLIDDATSEVFGGKVRQPWDVLRPAKRLMDAEQRYISRPLASRVYETITGDDFEDAPALLRGGLEAVLSPSNLLGPGLVGKVAARAGVSTFSRFAAKEGLARYVAQNTAAAAGAGAGGALAEEAGLPGLAGGLVGGSLAGMALSRGRRIQNLAPDDDDQLRLSNEGGFDPAEEARRRKELDDADPPAEISKPLPGQRGLFGEEVDESGAIKPPPQEFGHTGEEGFRGEQGGMQPHMFTREETGQAGQMGLEEGLRLGDNEAKITNQPPATGDLPPQITSQSSVPTGERGRIKVKASDVEARPEIFQGRDVDPGKPFGEQRVNEITRAWDDAAFVPPSVVPDPNRPGKFIVFSGHHRTEAFRRVKGNDAEMEVNLVNVDVRDPATLQQIKREAITENYRTAEPNYREDVRTVQRLKESGMGVQEIADGMRAPMTKVEALDDAARVGDAAIDRVVIDSTLEPFIEALGRGMRLYGIDVENANGWFERIATGPKGQRPTPAAFRETIERVGDAWHRAEMERQQGALFGGDVGRFEGMREGILALVDANARMRTELAKQIRLNQRDMKGVERLAKGDPKAAARLLKKGEAEVARLEQLLRENEEDLLRAFRGQEPEARPDPVSAKAVEPEADAGAGSRDPQSAGSGGEGTAAPPPPRTPEPPGTPKAAWGAPIDQLIQYVRAAGAVRPGLLARRKEVLARRVAKMAERLEDEGVPAEEAFKRARQELRGELADPRFIVPEGGLDIRRLHQEILDARAVGDVEIFEGLAAAKGLDKLANGLMPQPNEIEKLGLVFGPRLQEAIEEMGDIFKVQRRVEQIIIENPVRVEWPDGRSLSPDDLAQALAQNVRDLQPEQAGIIAERMIAEDRIRAIAQKDGRVVVTSQKPNAGRMQQAYDEIMSRETRGLSGESEGVPPQILPPSQVDMLTGVEQPNLAAAGEVTLEPGGRLDFPPQQPPDPDMMWNLNRKLAENERNRAIGGGGEPGKATTLETVVDAMSLPRGIMAGLDFSYPLRQGLLMLRHMQEFGNAFKAGIKAWGDEDFANTTMYILASKERGNLHISPLEGGRLLVREEQFLSRWLGNIPLVRESQRANIVFINKLRADVYDSTLRMWERVGASPTQKDLDALGNYINRATGWGKLEAFGETAAILGQTLFSPRTLLARFQAPAYMFHKSDLVRNEAIKDFTTVFGGISALLTLAGLSGAADVEIDPRSSDFGKLRVGSVRIDPWGGYQQLARHAAQMLSGERKTLEGEIQDRQLASSVWGFMRSKFSPQAGFFADMLEGKTYDGEDFTLAPKNLQNVVINYATPLFIQGMYEGLRDEGLSGAVLNTPSFFGVGTQTYEAPLNERLDALAQDAYDRSFRDLKPEQIIALADKFPDRIDRKAASRAASFQKVLEPYFAIEDQVWDRINDRPGLQGYATEDDYVAAKAAELRRMGVPERELGRRIQQLPVIRQLQSAVDTLHERYRQANPDADKLLVAFYGYAPVRRPTRRRRRTLATSR